LSPPKKQFLIYFPVNGTCIDGVFKFSMVVEKFQIQLLSKHMELPILEYSHLSKGLLTTTNAV
jgi:hypothetical protein